MPGLGNSRWGPGGNNDEDNNDPFRRKSNAPKGSGDNRGPNWKNNNSQQPGFDDRLGRGSERAQRDENDGRLSPVAFEQAERLGNGIVHNYGRHANPQNTSTPVVTPPSRYTEDVSQIPANTTRPSVTAASFKDQSTQPAPFGSSVTPSYPGFTLSAYANPNFSVRNEVPDPPAVHVRPPHAVRPPTQRTPTAPSSFPAASTGYANPNFPIRATGTNMINPHFLPPPATQRAQPAPTASPTISTASNTFANSNFAVAPTNSNVAPSRIKSSAVHIVGPATSSTPSSNVMASATSPSIPAASSGSASLLDSPLNEDRPPSHTSPALETSAPVHPPQHPLSSSSPVPAHPADTHPSTSPSVTEPTVSVDPAPQAPPATKTEFPLEANWTNLSRIPAAQHIPHSTPSRTLRRRILLPHLQASRARDWGEGLGFGGAAGTGCEVWNTLRTICGGCGGW
jgi:hypothetical protein